MGQDFHFAASIPVHLAGERSIMGLTRASGDKASMEDSQGPVPGGDVSPADRPASPPRHRRAISVAAILLLLAAGAGAWYWFNHHLAGVTAARRPPAHPP